MPSEDRWNGDVIVSRTISALEPKRNIQTDKSDNTTTCITYMPHAPQTCIKTQFVSTVTKAGSVADSAVSVKCSQYPKVQGRLIKGVCQVLA